MPDLDSTEAQLDLALAAELQAALLPEQCPTDCKHHRAAARNRMCRSIGGDFYDFIRINEDQFAIIIGDVSGHGVRAALVMAKIMGWLRSDPESRSRPLRVMAGLNRMLIELGDRTGTVTPCSMIYIVLDAPTGIAFLVNAGHPKPFLCTPDTCKVLHLGQQNMLLGVQEFGPVEDCHTFSPAERLILFTDGITDATNTSGERFASTRLHEVVSEYAASDPDQCADGVFNAIDQFRENTPQSDDETIVVVDRI